MRFNLGTYLFGVVGGIGLTIGGAILFMIHMEREDAARPIRDNIRFEDINVEPFINSN